MKENFKIVDRDTGKEYWISRSMAVTTILRRGDKFLFQRRGPGCPDNIGKLCCSCGYLNWGETLKQAAIRELYEETGVLIQERNIKPWKLIDDPGNDIKENVTQRFVAEIPENTPVFLSTDTKSRGGEKDEVSELLWLTGEEILEMNPKEFAFNHQNLIKELLKEENK